MIFPLSRVHLYEVFFKKNFSPLPLCNLQSRNLFLVSIIIFFPSCAHPYHSRATPWTPPPGFARTWTSAWSDAWRTGSARTRRAGSAASAARASGWTREGGAAWTWTSVWRLCGGGGRRPCGRARWGHTDLLKRKFNSYNFFCPSGVVVAVVAAHHHLPVVAADGDGSDAAVFFVTISAKLVFLRLQMRERARLLLVPMPSPRIRLLPGRREVQEAGPVLGRRRDRDPPVRGQGKVMR